MNNKSNGKTIKENDATYERESPGRSNFTT